MDFFRRPIFFVIIAVALIIAGIWAYIANRSSNSTSNSSASTSNSASPSVSAISNLTNADAGANASAISDQLALSDTKAADAGSNYALSAIEVVLPSSLAVNSGNTFYVYNIPNDSNYNWVISVSNQDNSFVRSKTLKTDFLGNLSAINRSMMKENYIQALQIAEKNGGLDFRQNNSISEVDITLKNADPKGWLYWFVNYIAKGGQKEIQIDANTGAIVSGS